MKSKTLEIQSLLPGAAFNGNITAMLPESGGNGVITSFLIQSVGQFSQMTIESGNYIQGTQTTLINIVGGQEAIVFLKAMHDFYEEFYKEKEL
jgi:hypothetical protein